MVNTIIAFSPAAAWQRCDRHWYFTWSLFLSFSTDLSHVISSKVVLYLSHSGRLYILCTAHSICVQTFCETRNCRDTPQYGCVSASVLFFVTIKLSHWRKYNVTSGMRCNNYFQLLLLAILLLSFHVIHIYTYPAISDSVAFCWFYFFPIK